MRAKTTTYRTKLGLLLAITGLSFGTVQAHAQATAAFNAITYASGGRCTEGTLLHPGKIARLAKDAEGTMARYFKLAAAGDQRKVAGLFGPPILDSGDRARWTSPEGRHEPKAFNDTFARSLATPDADGSMPTVKVEKVDLVVSNDGRFVRGVWRVTRASADGAVRTVDYGADFAPGALGWRIWHMRVFAPGEQAKPLHPYCVIAPDEAF